MNVVDPDTRRVLMGKILSPHGVKGQVKVWSYTELPYNIISYGPLTDKSGNRSFELTLDGQTQGGLIARIKGVNTRDEAERLRNTELYISRDKLPATKSDEYYQSDMVGMDVFDEHGGPFGRIAGFHNFGAGTIIEVRLAQSEKSELYAFTQKTFPVIDIAARRIVIHPPEEIIADAGDS